MLYCLTVHYDTPEAFEARFAESQQKFRDSEKTLKDGVGVTDEVDLQQKMVMPTYRRVSLICFFRSVQNTQKFFFVFWDIYGVWRHVSRRK